MPAGLLAVGCAHSPRRLRARRAGAGSVQTSADTPQPRTPQRQRGARRTQVVVATPCQRGGRIGLGASHCCPQAVRRRRAENSGEGSGRLLRRACPVRMLQPPPLSRGQLERDGSGRLVACHQRCSRAQRSHCLAAISRLRKARRSRSCECEVHHARHSPADRASGTNISRELRRNAATRSGGLEYRATTVQWHAERLARRPKQGKLAVNPTLRGNVQERLADLVIAAGGTLVPGPAVVWTGRRHGRRQDRRWACAWSPE